MSADPNVFTSVTYAQQWQRCPVCNGRGMVPHGFYNTSPTVPSTSTADEQCRRCKGQGTILSPKAESHAP